MPATETVKRLVWVKSGGRCLICHQYLLQDHLEDGDAIRAIGEVAHVAGESLDGPRGASSVSAPDRNDPTNLILLCPSDHRSADKRTLQDPIYTEEYLLGLKNQWERFVRDATGLDPARTTTVLRMAGNIKGPPGRVPVADVSEAVLGHALRMPTYLDNMPHAGAEIDLTRLPDTINAAYWSAALAQIDDEVARLHRAVSRNLVDHLSVFAIAYVPLLVALGNKLDDMVAVEVYDKHRSSESWSWDPTAAPVPFTFEMADAVDPDDVEGVLIVNASGTVNLTVLPEAVQGMPVFVIRTSGGMTPGTSTFENAETLAMFDAAVRAFFAELEERHRPIRVLHLFAAAPVSAAVTIGRRLPVSSAAPGLALYHFTDNSYIRAFDVPTPPPSDQTQEVRT